MGAWRRHAVGMLAEMLAAGLNANLGGRDHIPIEVERQIVEWTRAMFGFPREASGIFVTGTSMANLMAVLVARTAALGQRSGSTASAAKARCSRPIPRRPRMAASQRRWTLPASAAMRCEVLAVDRSHRVDVAALRARSSRIARSA